MTAGREHAPVVVVAEELVRDPLHVHEVFLIGADAAEDAEDRLHEQRRLDQPAVEEMGEVVEVPDVVAFELEAGAVGLAELAQYVFDVLERIPEDEVPAVLQVPALPFVLELRVAVEHRIQPEVHRAHVERAHLGLRPQCAGEPLLERHPVPAAGGDVHHRIAALLDARQELHEYVRARRGAAVLGVARVEMDDRGARLGRLDGLLRDLRGSQRQVRRHRGGVDRPGGRTRDDHLFLLRGHAILLAGLSARGFTPTVPSSLPVRPHHATNAARLSRARTRGLPSGSESQPATHFPGRSGQGHPVNRRSRSSHDVLLRAARVVRLAYEFFVIFRPVPQHRFGAGAPPITPVPERLR